MQRSQSSGNKDLETSRAATTKKLAAVGLLINKCRMVQNWNLLTPAESALAEKIWLEQLDRHGVPMQHYTEILNRAVDRRIMSLAKNEHVPSLSVELLLAMFRELKTDLHEKCQDLVNTFKPYESSAKTLDPRNIYYAPQIARILEKAETDHRRQFTNINDLREFLESRIADKPKTIQDFWNAHHLPDEATEWLKS